MSLGLTILVAIMTYTMTNIDDFCVLLVFFARARSGNEDFKSSDIIKGQIFGFTILCSISLLGLVLGLFLSAKYISLIGFVPILMGCKGFFELYEDIQEDSFAEDMQVVNVENKNDSTISNMEIENCPKNLENEEETILSNLIKVLLARVLRPKVLEVCSITIANGGDNIAIYLPLFASTNGVGIVITLTFFYLMLAIWLLSTFLLVNGKGISDFLNKYGSIVVPIFLVLLGFYILLGSVIFEKTPLYQG